MGALEKGSADVTDRRWFKVAGWTLLHPTRLAFQGVAILALIAVLFSAARAWWNQPPHWSLILGFAVLWILGATAAWLIHQAFNHPQRYDLPNTRFANDSCEVVHLRILDRAGHDGSWVGG